MAGERCADPAPLVYQALFTRYPDLEVLFVRDRDGAVRGEMLAKLFETIIDLVGNRVYGENMIRCEAATHAGYGVPPEIFVAFYDVLRDTVSALADADWTYRHQAAWTQLISRMTALSL